MNCHQTESSAAGNSNDRSKKRISSGNIDSLKFKDAIFRIDTLFEKLYLSNAFNGNVLIARSNQIIYQKSFGYAIKEENRMLHDSSLFQLASVSKVITGTATLLLYEQGKLKLEEKVADILIGFPYKDVTIRHLLSHRSGLPNYTYFCEEFASGDTSLLSNQDVLDIMIRYNPKPYFNPGVRFNYSNTNFALLALVIEKKTQKSFSEFLKDAVFIPLKMNHSFTIKQIHPSSPGYTQGYTMTYKRVSKDRFDGVLGDKGIYTTTYDLFLLSSALYNRQLLSANTQQLAYTPQSPEKKLSNYGLGWRMHNFSDPNKEVFHNGWWHGYRTSFHRRLRDTLTIVVLSNRLNRSVYSTWRIYGAIDGAGATALKPATDEE